MRLGRRGLVAGAAVALAGPAMAQRPAPATTARPAQQGCRGPVYLTIDTGWGREAEQIAGVLRRHHVRATLFLANEPTFRGDSSLSEGWAPFWRARAAEGHAFASHTWRHWYFTRDLGDGRVVFRSRRNEGEEVLDRAALCAELARPIEALRSVAPEARVLPLWRAPGGIVTPNAVRLAAACGLKHQGWTRNGFLGDELDSATHPNAALLRRNLDRIGPGEVLVMHWGVRSRREPFGAIMEELVTGLLARGFCFEILPEEGRA